MKSFEQAWLFLKMSADEADELEERMLSDMERGTSNPRSRRKQRSMGERESKPSIHNLPGSSSRREMWDEKQKERNWERWGKRHAENKAIEGKDLPSYHGFGGDKDREIHPGDKESNWSSIPKSGRWGIDGVGRHNRPIDTGDFDSMGDFMDFLLSPGGIEQMNPDLSFHPANEDTSKPWTTSGPTNYVPETEEWVDNIFDNNPTFHGTPFNEDTGFTTGEPMDIAYQLLKFLKPPKMAGRRNPQMKLDEFGLEPSRYGPVKYYHGTSGDRVSGIQSQGLQPNLGKVWVSQRRGVADNYAGGRSANRFLDEVMQPGGNLASPTQKPTTFGIREAAGDPNQHMGMSSFDKTVQPEHLVRMPPTQKPADPEWHTGKPQTGTGAQGQ